MTKKGIRKTAPAVFLALSMLAAACSNGGGTLFQPDRSKLLSSPEYGVYYEIFVRSFADSNGDRMGDLKGATQKLDYLKDLGIEGIWLMPVNPSPSYHGYDVTDYKEVNPDYGTLDDMKAFVQAAHDRNIKVIVDLVVNHTSDQHPWFRKAISGDAKYENYYVWANQKTNVSATGDWGQKIWHNSAGSKYEGIFWGGMPDLNFDNPEVRKEVVDIGIFWLKEIGVDGFRLDAAKHIYSKQDIGKDEEKDHEWWRQFRSEMEKVNPDVVMVGEVWDSASVIAPYLKDGLTSAFNFDLSGSIVSAVVSESDTGLVSKLARTREYFAKVSGGEYVDSTFIANHDMNRVMTQVNGNLNHAKMAASLLLTLPGNPFIYYGEEIGMFGAKPDELIREPFLWKKDNDAPEQTKWEANKINRNFAAGSLEAQLEDEQSLFHHYQTMIHVRRSNKILIEGGIESSLANADGIMAFIRNSDQGKMLVIHNLIGEGKSYALSAREQDFNSVYFSTSEEAGIKKDGAQVQVKLPAYSTLILNAVQ